MENKTHVVYLPDLYKLIPACKSLENKNFLNIKELLTNLISTIESANGWEFVQYISNKPSLFVVRQRTGVNTNYSNPTSVRTTFAQPESITEPVYEAEEKYDNSASYDETETSYHEEVPKKAADKLPWED